MSIYKIAEAIEKFAPKDTAEDWDNTGVIIDSCTPNSSLKKVLVCIDFTDAVLEECIENNVKYVISYHPVIFHSMKKITDKKYVKCIQNQISVYSPHTQLDPLMNQYILEMIGQEPRCFEEIVLDMKKLFKLEQVRVVRSSSNRKYTNKGDILVGVGAAFRNVTHTNCLLITGEMSHHDMLACKKLLTDVILLEHSNSERIFLPKLIERLKVDESMKGFDFIQSKSDVDPVEIV